MVDCYTALEDMTKVPYQASIGRVLRLIIRPSLTSLLSECISLGCQTVWFNGNANVYASGSMQLQGKVMHV